MLGKPREDSKSYIYANQLYNINVKSQPSNNIFPYITPAIYNIYVPSTFSSLRLLIII
ncbi:hypothetical protein Hanom_Chr04g00364131 [Helianthus anomalus]